MGGDLTQQSSSQTGMTDLINATKGQALNTGALVQSSQNVATSTANQVTQTTNLVTQATNQVTQTTALVTATNNLVTQATNLVTAFNSLSTSINNALSQGPWTTWSPAISSSVGTITTLGTVVARYSTAGKTVYFDLVIPITTNGTGSGLINATLPLTSLNRAAFSGRETTSSGKTLAASVNTAASSAMTITFYDATYPGANGFVLVVSGVYEAS